jgi:hypothetical protein
MMESAQEMIGWPKKSPTSITRFSPPHGLPPDEQWRLAQELVAGEHFVAVWEEWQQRLAAQGDVAAEAEIDATVAQARAERCRGKR